MALQRINVNALVAQCYSVHTRVHHGWKISRYYRKYGKYPTFL